MTEETREVFKTLKKEHQQVLMGMVFEALNQTKAYMAVYPKITEESARRAASDLMTKVDMQEAKQELLDELKEKSNVTFEWLMGELVEVVKSAKLEEKVDYNAIKGSINEINKMLGNHAPEKRDLTSGGKPLSQQITFVPVGNEPKS